MGLTVTVGRKLAAGVLAIAIFAFGPSLVIAAQSSGTLRINPDRPAVVPKGFISFCFREPQHCLPAPPRTVPMDESRWSELRSVNNLYNATVSPVTDHQRHGVQERWEHADKFGDCEDYVLAKKSHLVATGWPRSSLLIAVVDIPNVPPLERRHAVLLVKTNEGILVLDNREPEIHSWERVDYKWISVQSGSNPYVWHRVDRSD